MDYPVIDIEGTGIRIRELSERADIQYLRFQNTWEQAHRLCTDT